MISLDSLPAEARQAVQDLQAEVDALAGLPAEIARLQKIIELQNQKIRLLNFKLWGPKGDTISPAQTALLFDEASVTSFEIEQEASLPPAQKENPLPRARRPHPNHPGREKLPEHLERREVIIPCHPQDRRCDQCGAERPVIGYERSEELVCDPATFHLKVEHHRSAWLAVFPNEGSMVAPGFFTGLHRHGGLIGLQVGTFAQFLRLRPRQRGQQSARRQDAGRHGGPAQVYPVVLRQHGALPIDGRVLLVFPGQRLDDKFIGKFALGHDLGRGGGGGHPLFLLTMGTPLFPQGHPDMEGGRIADQFLAPRPKCRAK